MDKSYHNSNNNNNNNSFNGTKNDDFKNNDRKIIETQNNNQNNNLKNYNNNVLTNDGMNELKRNRIAKRKKKKRKKKTGRYSLIKGWCGFKDLNLSSTLPFSVAVSQSGNRMIKRISGKGQKLRRRGRSIFKKVSLKLLHKSKKTGCNSNDEIQKKRKMLISSYCCDITFNHFAFYYSPLSFTLFSFSPPSQKQVFSLLPSQIHNSSCQFNQFRCSALAA